jgi:hypothetical protein
MRRLNGTNGTMAPPDEDENIVPHAPEVSTAVSPATAPLLLDETTAAALLSISPRKLWELSACGAISFIKIGALKRYRRCDLEDWVRRGCPTAPQG